VLSRSGGAQMQLAATAAAAAGAADGVIAAANAPGHVLVESAPYEFKRLISEPTQKPLARKRSVCSEKRSSW
jgi:hypothetical protein